jgi:hypothetical protein
MKAGRLLSRNSFTKPIAPDPTSRPTGAAPPTAASPISTVQEVDMKKSKDNSGVIMLPAELLQQDIVIIDDQDDHIVLTVRISKATILKNHALLMALSEAASS